MKNVGQLGVRARKFYYQYYKCIFIDYSEYIQNILLKHSYKFVDLYHFSSYQPNIPIINLGMIFQN
jgi:hypothetical protein